MASKNWLPRKVQDLVVLMKIWLVILGDAAKCALFGWDAAECAAVISLITEFLDALEAYELDDSSRNLLLKDEALEAARASMQDFANSSVRFNKKMGEADRQDLGVHTRDPHNTPRPKPTDYVDFDLSVNAHSHEVTGKYRIEGSTSRGKGAYHGVEIRYWILPLDAPPPESARTEGWHSVADTASPWKHTFDNASEIGKRLYVAMCWENNATDTEDDKGPWSAIESVIIP
ncbi:MAG: hypothetical protein LBS64_02190 [Spirochaetaceae bacterium]|nr:hypothetical protein [Spirochaetaceae bacterium]